MNKQTIINQLYHIINEVNGNYPKYYVINDLNAVIQNIILNSPPFYTFYHLKRRLFIF